MVWIIPVFGVVVGGSHGELPEKITSLAQKKIDKWSRS